MFASVDFVPNDRLLDPDARLNPKALSYKVEYWCKPILAQLGKIENEIAFYIV